MSEAIEDYALIGDLHTAALVSRSGSIDWLCLPRFDSPACFAALLHDDSAGFWRLAPPGGTVVRRQYRGDTLLLETEWRGADGSVRVLDCMPPRDRTADVVRVVEGLSGTVRMRSRVRLRFDYGHVRPWVRRVDSADDSGDFSAAVPGSVHSGQSVHTSHSGHSGHSRHSGCSGVEAVAGPDAVWLRGDVPFEVAEDGIDSEFDVSAGERVSFVLTYRPSRERRAPAVSAEDSVAATERFWTAWISRCEYDGRWSAAVRRALITLKALTYPPTGGILAAATTSLPERIGGPRNWDYRYCWLRDATFTLEALIGTGYVDEAKAWREWLLRAVAGDPAKLRIMYGLDGSRRIVEYTMDWLSGYRGSSPVRVGNAAAGQLQLDVWGEVIDGLHLSRAGGLAPNEAAWDMQRALLDHLEGAWREPDNGLWEVRGPRRQFVHSKVMAWVGFDRAAATVEHHGLDGPADRWRALRDEVHEEVCAKGFDTERNTFTQYYGSSGLDAATLLIPRVGFLPWSDPRVVGTVDAVMRELMSDGLLRRYDTGGGEDVDGLPGEEGAFLACSFWLVDALAGIGRRKEAETMFERLLDLRNDVGLLSEEYDPATGHHLGNTPQAFSLVGLVNSARQLDRADDSDRADRSGGGDRSGGEDRGGGDRA